jgi:hypothetical protein
MSTDFLSLTPIHFADIFDGRLESVGIHEHRNEETTSNKRCLTDGRNFLWVHSNEQGLVTTFTRYAYNAPQRILRMIADEFDVDIVSEHEPEFWGYETQEQWYAARDAMGEKDQQDFYNEVAKFVRGENHEIKSGTVGMTKAGIAKRLVTESPELLDEDRRRELIKAVETIYDRDHSFKVTLPQQEIDFLKMVATRRSAANVEREHKTMITQLDRKASAKYLRLAQPRLICRAEEAENQRSNLTNYISEVEHGCDEIINEGYDPDHSPLGCPVYWRVVKRGDEYLYCSTFVVRRDQIIRAWGTKALAFCDPVTGMAVARIETLLQVSGRPPVAQDFSADGRRAALRSDLP